MASHSNNRIELLVLGRGSYWYSALTNFEHLFEAERLPYG